MDGGTYTAADGRLELNPTEVYAADRGHLAPQPVTGQPERYAYSVSGKVLTVTYLCAPNELCAPIRPTSLYAKPVVIN
jgi:hypothetical protein